MLSLSDLFLRQIHDARPAQPPLPASMRPVTPSVEAADAETSDAHEDIVFFGDSIGIEYTDGDDQFSRRRITVHWVKELEADLLVHSFCQERRAPRCFRVSRITGLIDLQTGEMTTEVVAIRQQFAALTISGAHSPANATEAALRELRPGVNILVFMARCDGFEHISEREVILDYLDSMCPAPGIDIDYANRCIARLYPDVDTFSRAVRILDRRDRPELHRVARHMRRLVDADGVLSDREAIFAAELMATLR